MPPNSCWFSEEGKADDSIYERGYDIQIDESGYDYINNIYGSPLHKTRSHLRRCPRQSREHQETWVLESL
jgi:hypothetical protein